MRGALERGPVVVFSFIASSSAGRSCDRRAAAGALFFAVIYFCASAGGLSL
jgi:hypothetical protein